MSKRTITVTVKPKIDHEAIEEAARLAADYFLSSFATAIIGRTQTEPLAAWERELIEVSTDPAWNPRNAQGYDLLRSALNAASIDARANTSDHELVNLLAETAQGREVLRRLDRMAPPEIEGDE